MRKAVPVPRALSGGEPLPEPDDIVCAAVSTEHNNFISCICISDGPRPYIASASWDCTVLVHDLRSRELRATIHSPPGAIISAVSTCCRIGKQDLIASFSMDGKIRIYDALQEFQLIYCFDHNSVGECSVLGAVCLVYFDRPYCVSGGVDRVIRVRDLHRPKEVYKELRGHGDGVKALDVSDKGVIASGSNDNDVKLWDIFTGKFLRTLRGHFLEVNAVHFVKESPWLISGSEDNMFRVWDYSTGERLRIFKGIFTYHNVCFVWYDLQVMDHTPL
jgi:WD40 repeat protein